MIDMTVGIDKQVIDKMNMLIDRMQKVTQKEMKKVVRNAARDLARAALKHTPKANKNKIRYLKVDPSYRTTEKNSKGYIYLPAPEVKPAHRGLQNRVVKAGEKTDPRVTVHPGLAKSGWAGCMSRLGIGGQKAGSEKSAGMFSEASVSNDWENVIFANTVPFIEDFNNGKNKKKTPLNILEKSMREVNDKWEKKLEQLADKIASSGGFK